jgi:hypothetical protein
VHYKLRLGGWVLLFDEHRRRAAWSTTAQHKGLDSLKGVN